MLISDCLSLGRNPVGQAALGWVREGEEEGGQEADGGVVIKMTESWSWGPMITGVLEGLAGELVQRADTEALGHEQVGRMGGMLKGMEFH